MVDLFRRLTPCYRAFRLLAALVCACTMSALLAEPARADWVYLDDGSVVRGEIKHLRENDLVIDVEFAPDITIDLDNVVTVETDQRVTVRYPSGAEYTGYLWKDADGKAILKDRPATGAKTLAESGPDAPSSQGGEPPVEEPAVVRVVDLHSIERLKQYETYYRYDAAIDSGISAARGNTDRSAYNFAARFAPAFGSNTLTFSGQLNREDADGDTVVSNWRAMAQYERDLKNMWYVMGFNTYENDEKQNLDLRTTVGAGLGRKIFDPKPTLLKLGLAVGWVREDFERPSDPADVPDGFDDHRDYGAMIWITEFYHDMFDDDVRFYHDHRLTGGVLGETSLIVLTTTGLKFELISDLSLKAEVQFDYNTDPGSEADKDDERYLLKLSYEFEGDETDWFQ